MIIKLEKMTPEVYTSESRDFQLLCRLYDCIFNGVKGDTDSIVNVLNTLNIMSSMLALLKTKLGFQSTSNYSDEELRYILRVFPYIIKSKGSIKAIKEMVNMCLKLYNISAHVNIERVGSETVITGNIDLDKYSILVGIDTVLKSTDILKELCTYVMPPGFTMYVYFYTDLPMSLTYEYKDKIELLFSSDNLNSTIYTHPKDYDPTNTDYAVGDLIWVDGYSYQCKTAISKPAGEIDWNKWELLLSTKREEELLQAISSIYVGSSEVNFYELYKGYSSFLPTSGRSSGDVILVKDSLYYFINSKWCKLKYSGKYLSFPKVDDLPSLLENEIPIIEILPLTQSKKIFQKSYYRFNSSNWYKLNSRGSINETLVYNPQVNDFVAINGLTVYAKFCTNTHPITWESLNDYKGEIDFLPDNYVQTKVYNIGDKIILSDGIYICNSNNTTGVFDIDKWTLYQSLSNNDYYYLCKPAYYMYVNNKWEPCTNLMYTLAYSINEEV